MTVVRGCVTGVIAMIRTFVRSTAAAVVDRERDRRDLAVVEERIVVAAREAEALEDREVRPFDRRLGLAGRERADAGVRRADRGDGVGVVAPVLEAGVEERELIRLAGDDLAHVAGVDAFAAVHDVPGRARNGRPGQVDGAILTLEGHDRRLGRSPGAAAVVGRRRRAVDLVALEGRPDGRHVGRAVVQVAVVVVGREDRQVAAGRRAAAADRAGVPVADRLSADVQETRGDLVRRLRVVVEGRVEQVAGHEVPPGLRHDVALAVGLTAAGADGAFRGAGRSAARSGALAVREAAQDPRDRVRGIAAVVEVVDVADARAAVGRRAVAGVAVAAAGVVEQEAAADAGRVQPQGRIDVGDRLARARDVGVRAVVVHAVAPLVVEDRGDLARVAAALRRPPSGRS